MKTLIKSITGTSNVIVNSFVAFVLSFIAICLVAVICNVIVNPDSISFGLI